MFRSRNFLMGLGIGFVLIGLVLILFRPNLSAETEEEKDYQQTEDLSIEELKKVASAKGFFLYTQEEIDQITAEKTNQTCEKEIYFTIAKGMDSSNIAEYLVEIGLIDDKEAFLNLLTEKNLITKIQTGTYKAKEKMSTEEVIDLITP